MVDRGGHGRSAEEEAYAVETLACFHCTKCMREMFFITETIASHAPPPMLCQVCAFLAPLLQKGLVRAHAEAVCDLPGLGVFAEVPLALSLEVEEGLFALDHGADYFHINMAPHTPLAEREVVAFGFSICLTFRGYS